VTKEKDGAYAPSFSFVAPDLTHHPLGLTLEKVAHYELVGSVSFLIGETQS
jgi:hypothetical protein